jgi:RNA polymerase sigma-70 factor (ECF subfamily)
VDLKKFTPLRRHVNVRRTVDGAGLDEIEVVYRRRLPELIRVATAITGSREAGLDAVQDAFALAVHRRAQFRRQGALDAWLWRIVVRTSRDVAAGASASPMVADERFESADEMEEATEDGDEDVQTLVRRLPERQRVALFLHYYADLDYGTIADALEIKGGTVGALLNQARESLRQSLAEVTS